ncbi:unnamed protein product [Effrenium voratum]|nr:unnamed protein product [Effrenium voratum]
MAPPPAPAPGPPQRHVTDPLSEQPLKTGICWLSPTCDKKTYAKSKFCSAHKKEAEALKRDAEKSGKNALQFYLSQCSSQTLYSKMLIEFMGRCQSRGKGAGRERFNWVQYQETCYRSREVRRGSKDQMMCYEQWMDVSQAKHKRSWEESDRMWTEFSNDSEREKDQMGPECSKLRIECPVKDYILREDVSGYSKARVAAHKQMKNPKQEDMEKADSTVCTSLPRWTDSHFAIGNKSGATSNGFMHGDQAAAAPSTPMCEASAGLDSLFTPEKQDLPGLPENKKKNIKDISRYRTKKYDAVMKTYKSLDLKCDSLHKQVSDFCSSKDNTDEFKHFIDLAKFKLEFMGRLSTSKDAEEWCSYLESLSEQEKAMLPGDLSLLHCPAEIDAQAS